MKKTSVLIVDDHEMVRAGLKSLLEREHELVIIGEAATAADAVAGATRLNPDVVLLDVRLPDGSGVDACREIRERASGVHVIMLTSYADDDALFAAIAAGAAGYLLKQIRADELIRAVEAVAAGQSLLDPAVTSTVIERMKRLASGEEKSGLGALSAQERRVLALVAEGKTNKEIAVTLGLSDKTVKNYLSHVFDKLAISRRAEAAALFARSGEAPLRHS